MMSMFVRLFLLFFAVAVVPSTASSAPSSIDVGLSYASGSIILDDGYTSNLTESGKFRPEIRGHVGGRTISFYKSSSAGYYIDVSGGHFRLTEQEKYGYVKDVGTSANASYIAILPTAFFDFESLPTFAVSYGVGYWDVSGDILPDSEDGVVGFNFSGLRKTTGFYAEGALPPPAWNMYMGISFVDTTISSAAPERDVRITDMKLYIVKRFEW